MRRVCARMIVAEAVAALLKWATVATQLRSLRAMMERALSASRTWLGLGSGLRLGLRLGFGFGFGLG